MLPAAVKTNATRFRLWQPRHGGRYMYLVVIMTVLGKPNMSY